MNELQHFSDLCALNVLKLSLAKASIIFYAQVHAIHAVIVHTLSQSKDSLYRTSIGTEEESFSSLFIPHWYWSTLLAFSVAKRITRYT